MGQTLSIRHKCRIFIALLVFISGDVFSQQALEFAQNGVTAHRGNSGQYVENTMAAFRSALELGVDWIECDIFLTRDNQIVVTHDATTDRLTGISGRINDFSYGEILALDTGYDFRRRNELTQADWPSETMPLLNDVLTLIKSQSRTRLSIQPKDASTAAAVRKVEALEMVDWVGFNDSNLEKMSLVKEMNSDLKVFWDRLNLNTLDQDIATAKRKGFESLVFNRGSISVDAIEKVQQAGINFGVWTVNDEDEMRRFIAMGVDRLYTDFPEIALKLSADRGQR